MTAKSDKQRRAKLVLVETSDPSSESCDSTDNENSPSQTLQTPQVEIKKRGRPPKEELKTRKPQQFVITDETESRKDDSGIKCGRCHIHTRDIDLVFGTNAVGRRIARAKCECGANKTRYAKKEADIPEEK